MVKCHAKQLNLENAGIFDKEQSPAFDVTLAFMLFRIIYSVRAALTCSTDKTSRQYCLDICKENAVI